jgi:hypothetical protein
MGNSLDGKKWKEDELIQVYELYLTEKNKIHEYNPNIIQLAKNLNRRTRAVEIQLLMFRAYEKQMNSNNYGFHNYSKLIPEIYEKMNASVSNNKCFPNLFSNFNKTVNGSVRREGEENSGRPLNKLIRTQLHDFIDKVINSHFNQILSNTPTKSILIFLGGAGNGKTDALSYTTELIFESSDLIDEIQNKYKNQIKDSLIANNGFLSKLLILEKQLNLFTIQDASSRFLSDENNIKSIEKVLDEFENTDSGILIICMNRGVLLDALNSIKNPKYRELFCNVNEANSIEAYFTDITDNFNVLINDYRVSSFSLDKSSLFDTDYVIKEINNSIKQSKWICQSISDNYNNLCFQNNNIDNLSKLLFGYEVYYNAKITFRELYHLYFELFYAGYSNFKNQYLGIYFCRLFLRNSTIKDPNELKKIKNEFNSQSGIKIFDTLLDNYIKLNEEIKTIHAQISNESLINKIQLFNPKNDANLIDTEELYQLVSILREKTNDIYIRDNKGQKFELVEPFLKIIKPLIDIYHSFEDLKFTTKQNIIENYKSSLLKLIREVLCAYIFNQTGYFNYQVSLIEYSKIDSDNHTNIQKQLREILGIHKIKPEIKLQLNKELTEYNSVHQAKVVIDVNLKQVLKFKPLLINNKPKPTYKVFESITTDDQSILLFLDFKNYIEIQKAIHINNDFIKLSAASIGNDFKIWSNNEIEKFSSIDFKETKEFNIDNIGSVFFDETSNSFLLTTN